MTRSPVSLVNAQSHLRVPRAAVERAVRAAFRLMRRPLAPLSLVIVDDREIRRLHREFLDQDSVTDVISFPLQDSGPVTPGAPFGEVVASAQTARRVARRLGHPPTHELLLYVVHGVLHLLGHDDHRESDRQAMRAAERHCLRAAGVQRDLFAGRD